MKINRLLLIFSGLTILISFSVKTTFPQTSGPMASTVYSFAFSGTDILAGTESGIFKSSDNGKTWLSTSLYNQIVQSICSNGEIVIAGISFGGMYISIDNGVTWEKLPVQKNFNRWNKVISIGSVFFTGTKKGVFASEDNGQHWVQTALDSGEVYLIFSNGSRIFAGTKRFSNTYYGIFTSDDNGKAWKQIFDSQSHIISISVSGSDIYVSTEHSEIYRSTDSGENWTKLDFDQRCISLSVIGSNIFAGTPFKGLYVSSDKGVSWKCILPDKSILNIIGNDSLVFCGTWKNGLYFSSDNGLNWTQTSLINLEIKPVKFKKKLLEGHWDDFVVSPLMAGNLVMVAFSLDSFFYHNLRYSDVFEKPCSQYVGEEFASGEFTIDNNFIYLSGYWTDNTYKNILTEAPCNSGKFEFKYTYKYYSNHMLHLKSTEPYKLPNTGVKAELYLYKK